MRPIKIAPSILSADFARLEGEIRQVEAAGADWLHVDVMDGHFVPNLTIGPLIVEAARRVTSLPLDVHLMIESPGRFLDAFAKAGASTLAVHVEAERHLHRTLSHIRQLGCKAGVVMNPLTAPELVRPCLPHVDLVLVMSVNPGFGGQKFIPSALDAVSRIAGWVKEENLDVDISIDGGIDINTIGAARRAGANVFVAGSAVFGAADRTKAVQELRHAAKGAPPSA